jgi:imidazolonepropionase-like amidohydrolase
MKFAGAPPTIKFALGENVKQSNWGDKYTSRYPQTRMGVEQLLRDEFAAARDYQASWREWKGSKKGIPPRRDLELEAIAEVLDGTRRIHCHSYRQDEILMLMRVCDEFGVRNVTHQHVLEGYKVADEMARRGDGASTFSDWWAYKMEVYDAIPYNGLLMQDAGVVVSFNSDSNELARRLNAEAGKARKYGAMPDADALKLVTLNPARQLGVADKVGTIEVGKDADLALWNGPPLSTYSRCEQTWVDGRKYFDRDEDRAERERGKSMRAALIQKALRGTN